MSIYKEATKTNLRFNLGNGEVTVCDLWHYGLEKLDSYYSQLVEELEQSTKTSLLKPKTNASKILELKIAIVKDVVETKLADKAEKEAKAFKQSQAKLIRDKLAEKRVQALDTKSEDELLAMLETLEA